MVEGLNANARSVLIGNYVGGEVHLIAKSNEMVDSDGATELSSKSQASTTTTSGDWTTTVDNNAGTTKLENSAEISFGNQSGFTHTQTVIQSTANADHFIVANEGSENVLEGDKFSYPTGKLYYTLGGE